MSGVNKAIILGTVGQDPETRYSKDGKAITNLSIATSEQWKDQSGQKQEKTTWHRCVFFGRLAEIAGEYVRKGSQVYVEGRMEHSTYTDKNGVEQRSFQINAQNLQLLSKGSGQASPKQERQQAPADDFSDESIPF